MVTSVWFRTAEYRIYKSVWPMWWNESMLLHALL
jgi:hypothetical protein